MKTSTKGTNGNTATTGYATEFSAEYIDGVKKSFDGLNKAVAKLPNSKEKLTVMSWIADTYLAASKTILSLANFAPEAA